MTTVSWTIPNRPQAFSYLLKEDTFYLLKEDGGKLIIGQQDWSNRAVVAQPTYYDRTPISSALINNY